MPPSGHWSAAGIRIAPVRWRFRHRTGWGDSQGSQWTDFVHKIHGVQKMSDHPEICSLLSTISSDLSSVLLPQLQSAKASMLGQAMVSLLSMIRYELSNGELSSGVAERRQRAGMILAEALHAAGTARKDLVQELRSAQPSARALSDATKALLGLRGFPGTPAQPTWEALTDLLKAEEKLATGEEARTREAGYEESGSGRVVGRNSDRVLPGPITTQQLQRYISNNFPEYNAVKVKAVVPLSGGFSKDTFIATFTDGAVMGKGWILRRDLAYSPARSTVLDEAPLLKALRPYNVSAPTVEWLEADQSVFGAAVMAMTRLPGSSDTSNWLKDSKRAQSIGAGAAELLARVHGVDVEVLPTREMKVPGTQGTTPRELISHMTEFWNSLDVDPCPLMEALLHWLDRQAPAAFGPPVLVHGDFGFHNLLVQGRRITALLDWEYSHIGDFHEDLASARQFVQRAMPWAKFLSLYEKASGFRADAALERYYTILMMMRIALGLFSILHAVRKGETRIDSKLAYVGRTYARRYVLDAAELAGI